MSFLTVHRAVFVAALGLAAACRPLPLAAQEEPAPKPAKKTVKADDSDNSALQNLSLTTGDGLGLGMTYLPGADGKDSIPVILLHDLKGSRQDFLKEGGLAPYLHEKLGCAVLAPDLRGHGESTTITSGKKTETLSAGKLTRQYPLMITQDLQAVKDFLWKKNNAEQLNIDKLCVVGVGMGASVALDFAWYDAMSYGEPTSRPGYYGPLKLGRFVKSMVLVTPEWSFPGLRTRQALASPDVRANISVMILVGKDNRALMDDAKRFDEFFAKYHNGPAEDKKETQTLWLGRLNTNLAGTKLLDEPSLDIPKLIAYFLNLRMVNNPDAKKIVWKERKRPHE
jgi:pimeloyl-ACP methyl ester carboxylesterase